MAGASSPPSREAFEVAVVCALPLEYDAATLIFDEFWDEDGDRFGKATNDPNSYTTGRIGRHNVVLALLPNMGKVGSAGAAASLRSSYTGLKIAVLAGVCGGVPGGEGEDEHDNITLGDVIISKRVVQFDLGRQYPDKFTLKDTVDDNLGRANLDIRSLVGTFETEFGLGRLEAKTHTVLESIQRTAIAKRRRTRYTRPPNQDDLLFASTYLHVHHDGAECGCSEYGGCEAAISTTCASLGCDLGRTIPRDRLSNAEPQLPRLHVGNVASGDTVMKSGKYRDRLAKEHHIIGFEMEGAGMWDQIPCVVVKGVCDYADSHKNKKWQPYAAIVAAAATRAILDRHILQEKPTTLGAKPHALDAQHNLDGQPTLGTLPLGRRTAIEFTNTGAGTQNNNSGSGNQYVAGSLTF